MAEILPIQRKTLSNQSINQSERNKQIQIDDYSRFADPIIIRVVFNDSYWPFQGNHTLYVAPFTEVFAYKPFKFDVWQLLYHQAPCQRLAQLLEFRSLSWSFVVNFIPFWVSNPSPTWKIFDEQPIKKSPVINAHQKKIKPHN